MPLACVTLFDHTGVWGYLPFPTDPVRVKSNACAATVAVQCASICLRSARTIGGDFLGLAATRAHPNQPSPLASTLVWRPTDITNITEGQITAPGVRLLAQLNLTTQTQTHALTKTQFMRHTHRQTDRQTHTQTQKHTHTHTHMHTQGCSEPSQTSPDRAQIGTGR